MQCKHQSICSGCTQLDQPLEVQKEHKIKLLRAGLSNEELRLDIPFFIVGPYNFRDRADLVITRNSDDKSSLGFYRKSKDGSFALEECLLMSKPLQSYYEQIRHLDFPIKKGSLRIRSGVNNNFGVWLDFANLDIKNLLDEKTILQKLLSLGEVEIGQRRKSLSAALKLQDPKFSTWSKTWIDKGRQELNLYSCIGSFSQTGSLANSIITRELNNLLELTEGKSWVEFGSGSGTLSFPLASFHPDINLTAVEFDIIAAEGFTHTLKSTPHLASKIQLLTGDYQRKEKIDFAKYTSILVNPPRSGLGNFLEPLIDLKLPARPQEFIYMSCHLDSFLKDITRLREAKYSLKDIRIIDQFPHTEHFEILSLWSL